VTTQPRVLQRRSRQGHRGICRKRARSCLLGDDPQADRRERSGFDLRPLGLEDLRGDASVVNVMGQIAVQVRVVADEPGWLACSMSDGAMPKVRARSP
jgi:hypothetical protein